MASGKRVVIYGMNYAPEMAGVGRYTGEIGLHLAESGADVTVITTPPHYPGWRVERPWKAGRYHAHTMDGARIIRCPLILRRRMGGVWRLVAPLSFAITSAPVALWQILTRRPHTVLCIEPTLFTAPVALLAAKLAGARTVLHVQDLEVDAAFAVGHLGRARWLERLAAAFERSVLRRFHHIVTISNRMAERIAAKGMPREHIALVRNWVDTGHIRPLGAPSPYRAELGLNPATFVVLYSGNIGAKQGLDLLIDAAAALADTPAIQFIIAGEGPAKDGLMARAVNLANVRFLPFQPYARLSEFLGLADLHALPQEEGAADLVLPSKLGGMLASGKPVLVTAHSGTELADYLAGAADVIPPGDAVAFAEAIRARAAEREPDGPAAARLALARGLSHTDALAEFAEVLFGGEPRDAPREVSAFLMRRAS